MLLVISLQCLVISILQACSKPGMSSMSEMLKKQHLKTTSINSVLVVLRSLALLESCLLYTTDPDVLQAFPSQFVVADYGNIGIREDTRWRSQVKRGGGAARAQG